VTGAFKNSLRKSGALLRLRLGRPREGGGATVPYAPLLATALCGSGPLRWRAATVKAGMVCLWVAGKMCVIPSLHTAHI